MSLILDLIFPRICYGCNRLGQYLCPDCQSKIITKSIIHQPKTDLEGRLSLFRYHGPIKLLISDLKFNFVTDNISELVNFAGTSLINNYPNLLKYWQDNNYVMTAIPLHPNRFHWRGFNQAELVGKQLSAILKIVYQPDILIRINNNPPQAKIRDKTRRRSNVYNSFKLSSNCLPKNIILFDDVCTTGSTIFSATSIFPNDTHIWTLTLAG